MKLKVFKLTGKPLWYLPTSARVAAPSEKHAKACMTVSSDSCWSDVTSCEFIEEREFSDDDLAHRFTSCGGYLL